MLLDLPVGQEKEKHLSTLHDQRTGVEFLLVKFPNPSNEDVMDRIRKSGSYVGPNFFKIRRARFIITVKDGDAGYVHDANFDLTAVVDRGSAFKLHLVDHASGNRITIGVVQMTLKDHGDVSVLKFVRYDFAPRQEPVPSQLFVNIPSHAPMTMSPTVTSREYHYPDKASPEPGSRKNYQSPRHDPRRGEGRHLDPRQDLRGHDSRQDQNNFAVHASPRHDQRQDASRMHDPRHDLSPRDPRHDPRHDMQRDGSRYDPRHQPPPETQYDDIDGIPPHRLVCRTPPASDLYAGHPSPHYGGASPHAPPSPYGNGTPPHMSMDRTPRGDHRHGGGRPYPSERGGDMGHHHAGGHGERYGRNYREQVHLPAAKHVPVSKNSPASPSHRYLESYDRVYPPHSPHSPHSPHRPPHQEMYNKMSPHQRSPHERGSFHRSGEYYGGELPPYTRMDGSRNPEHTDESALNHLIGRVVYLAKSESGSRFVQEKVGNPRFLKIFFQEMKKRLPELMTDNFGHYAVETLFTHCSSNQRITLLQNLGPSLPNVACHKQGSFSVQSLINAISSKEEILLMKDYLTRELHRVILSCPGHYVILRFISRFGWPCSDFISELLSSNVVGFATDHYGLRVMKATFDSATAGKKLEKLFDAVVEQTNSLAENQYGNYIIQHLFDIGSKQVTSEVKRKMVGRYVRYSKQKFSSNVVEKVLKHSAAEFVDQDPNWSAIIVKELLGSAKELISDKYGNYCLQTALATIQHDVTMVEEFVKAVEPHLEGLRVNVRNKWGKLLSVASTVSATLPPGPVGMSTPV